jgi:hypothetical protein
VLISPCLRRRFTAARLVRIVLISPCLRRRFTAARLVRDLVGRRFIIAVTRCVRGNTVTVLTAAVRR